MTFLERDGQPIAAILHDEVLLDDPALVASVASAVRLSVENDRLQAEVEAQLGEVRESRARTVEAGDDPSGNASNGTSTTAPSSASYR